MIAALKEYNDVCVKPTMGWIKRHWKGYSVFLAISFLVPAIVVKIMDAIEELQFTKVLNKKKEDEAE